MRNKDNSIIIILSHPASTLMTVIDKLFLVSYGVWKKLFQKIRDKHVFILLLDFIKPKKTFCQP